MATMTNTGDFEGLSGDRRKLPKQLRRKRRRSPPRRKRPGVSEKTAGRAKQPLTKCARCGQELPAAAGTGRPRIYCSPACRKAAYEDRRAKRPNATTVQLVDRVVVETIEKTVRVDHPQADCIANVLANPHAIRKVLIGISQKVGRKEITPDDEVFWDLITSTDYLREALARAAARHP